MVQILDFQPVEHDGHRQTSDKLGLKTIVNQVFRLDLFEIDRFLLPGLYLSTKTDSLPIQPLFDALFQTVKGPTHDKQDVASVDRLFAPFSCLPILFDGFKLRDRIMGHPHVDFGFLHGLQKCPLDARPGHIRSNQVLG